MVRLPVTVLTYGGGESAALSRVRRRNLPAVIMTAGGTNVVRALELAAIRAFQRLGRLQREMRAPHIAARLGDFLLRDGHNSFFLEKPGSGHKPARRDPWDRRVGAGARCLAEKITPGNPNGAQLRPLFQHCQGGKWLFSVTFASNLARARRKALGPEGGAGCPGIGIKGDGELLGEGLS